MTRTVCYYLVLDDRGRWSPSAHPVTGRTALFVDAQDISEATDCFTKAISKMSRNATAIIRAAAFLSQLGEPEDARSHC